MEELLDKTQRLHLYLSSKKKKKRKGNESLLKNEGSNLNVCSNWTLHIRVSRLRKERKPSSLLPWVAHILPNGMEIQERSSQSPF